LSDFAIASEAMVFNVKGRHSKRDIFENFGQSVLYIRPMAVTLYGQSVVF
jgi:hypothetical protein